jgi:periplasmic protein CpxP/Spy
MKRVSKVLLGTAVVAIGFVSLSAFGGHGFWHHGELTKEKAEHIATFMVDRMLDDVKATDQQRVQINAIKDQRVRDTVAFVQANKPVKAALLTAWESETPDAKAIHALIDQRIDALRTMAHQAVDDAMEVHQVLKPEQRATIAAHVREHVGCGAEEEKK